MADTNKYPKEYRLDEDDSEIPDLNQKDNYDGHDSKDSHEHKPSYNPFALMLKILTNPTLGWRNFKACKFSPADVERRCFYPLLAVLAVVCFSRKFYSPDVTLQQLLVDSITKFISYFFGYFIVLMTCTHLLPKEAITPINTSFGKNYILLGMSTLVFFNIFQVALPMLEPILVFLPIWTIYIMSKGIKYIRMADDKKNLTTGLIAVYCIGFPALLEWLFRTIAPISN